MAAHGKETVDKHPLQFEEIDNPLIVNHQFLPSFAS
jgi:hypothetical protein